MIAILTELASKNLLLGFMPESLGLLLFGVGLIAFAVSLRRISIETRRRTAKHFARKRRVRF